MGGKQLGLGVNAGRIQRTIRLERSMYGGHQAVEFQ